MQTPPLSDDCTCHHVADPWTYYGIVEPGGAIEPDPLCAVHFPPRWKIACINWTVADVPHAVTYLLISGDARMSRYWPTWADAVEYLDNKGDVLEAWAAHLLKLERERNES